jgi:hypothetical protein
MDCSQWFSPSLPRFCLYVWLGSLPRSWPGKSGCYRSTDFLSLRDYACLLEISVPATPPSAYLNGWSIIRRFKQQFLT